MSGSLASSDSKKSLNFGSANAAMTVTAMAATTRMTIGYVSADFTFLRAASSRSM